MASIFTCNSKKEQKDLYPRGSSPFAMKQLHAKIGLLFKTTVISNYLT